MAAGPAVTLACIAHAPEKAQDAVASCTHQRLVGGQTLPRRNQWPSFLSVAEASNHAALTPVLRRCGWRLSCGQDYTQALIDRFWAFGYVLAGSVTDCLGRRGRHDVA